MGYTLCQNWSANIDIYAMYDIYWSANIDIYVIYIIYCSGFLQVDPKASNSALMECMSFGTRDAVYT